MRENTGLRSDSVTMDIFLGRVYGSSSEPARTLPPLEEYAVAVQRAFDATSTHAQTAEYVMGPLSRISRTGTTILDQRRLEIEWGSGGDADIPFTFIPPTNLQQRLVWVHLLRRIHQGELEP
jgi:hypothetical protein